MSKHSIHFSPEVADGVTTSHFKRVKKIEGEVRELRPPPARPSHWPALYCSGAA